jgi:hypothetical protein
LQDQYHVRLLFPARQAVLDILKNTVFFPELRVVSSVVEQLAFNQLVDGSNPSRPTMK